MRLRRTLSVGGTQLLLLLACLLAAFPLFWVALTSLKNNRDATASGTAPFAFTPTFENFGTLFSSSEFPRAALTSVLITIVATLLVVVMATIGAYAFARLEVPGRRLLASVMVMVQVIPGIVLVIPIFRLVSGLRVYDSWFPIALILTGLAIPFATWLMLAFFRSLPVDVEEAAFVDGVNRRQLFQHVLVPMVAPGMATAAIFTAIAVWNSFLIPLVLGQTRARTLTVYAAQFITFQGVNWGPLCAAAVVILAPIVLFVLAMQRPLVKGLTAGSLKA